MSRQLLSASFAAGASRPAVAAGASRPVVAAPAFAVDAPRRTYSSVAVVTAGPRSGLTDLIENILLLLVLVGLFVVFGGPAWVESLRTGQPAASGYETHLLVGGVPPKSLRESDQKELLKLMANAILLDELEQLPPDPLLDQIVGVLIRAKDFFVLSVDEGRLLMIVVNPAIGGVAGDPLRGANVPPVDVASESLRGSAPVRADVRDAVVRIINVDLQVPAVRAVFSKSPKQYVVFTGHSVGGAVALGLALAHKNDRIAAAWGVTPTALLTLRATFAPAQVHGLGIGAPPFVRIDAGTAALNDLRLDGLSALLKEGDAVGVASAYTMQPSAPPGWELLPPGTLYVVADEDWYGRSAAERRRRAAGDARVYTAAGPDDSGKRRLVSREAFQRAATALVPSSQPNGASFVPFHTLTQYAALGAALKDEHTLSLPPPVEGWVPDTTGQSLARLRALY